MRREERAEGGKRDGSCYPVRSAVNVRANMFWFFFFWLMNTVTPSISKVGGSGSREYRISVLPTDRRQKAENGMRAMRINPSTCASPVR